MATESQDTIYRERRERYEQAAAEEQQRFRRIAWLRLLSFIAALGAFVWAEALHLPRASWPNLLGVVLMAAFIALMVLHARNRRRIRWNRALSGINEQACKRIARDWDALTGNAPLAAPAQHPYADDLDLFGKVAVARLVGAVATLPGRAVLD